MGREGGEFAVAAVEMGDGAGVEGGQAAAVEVVVDLGADGLERGVGGGGPLAQEKDTGGGPGGEVGLGPPIGVGGEFGEEAVDAGLVDPGQAAAVGL